MGEQNHEELALGGVLRLQGRLEIGPAYKKAACRIIFPHYPAPGCVVVGADVRGHTECNIQHIDAQIEGKWY